MPGHYHLTLSPIRKGKAKNKANYVLRVKGHENREDLHGSGDGNLPVWADGDPVAFFAAADKYERKNGTAGEGVDCGATTCFTS